MDPSDYPPPPPVPEPPAPGMPPAPPAPPIDITPPPPDREIPASPPVVQPPQYAPPAPPAPPENLPPSYAAQAVPQPAKKNTTLIIVLVVLGILLFCCIGGVIGSVAIFRAQTESSGGSTTGFDFETIVPDEADLPIDETGGRSEWIEFRPTLADPSIYAEPDAQQDALIREIHGSLYPDFVIEDTVAEPGVEDADSYHPDMLYVKASLASDPDVRIAYYLWADSEAAALAGVHLGEEQTESYETLVQSASGTYYIYDHENLLGLMEGDVDERIVSALAQADQDFPGYVAMMVGQDGDDIGVVLTRWSAFPDLEEALEVTFTSNGSGWTVSNVTDW